MKIALAIERMDPGRGGRETSTAQIAAALAEAGHQVTVLCQHGNWSHPGVAVRPLLGKVFGRVRRMRRFVEAAGRSVADERFDVVHAMLPLPGATVYQPRGGTIPGQRLAARRRWGALGPVRKLLADPLNGMRRYLGRLEADLVARPDVRCLAVSEMVAEEFREHYRLGDRVEVVYNAVDAPDPDSPQRADWRQETRYRLGVTRSDPVFVTAATNFPLKGVAELIRAFARFRHRQPAGCSPRLVVVGRDMVEGYQRLAGLNDVGREVVFAPATDEIFRWYAAADAVALLSWYDPCSRVVLEALRWGIPAITTRLNGACEALAGGAGFVVDSPRCRRDVADAMDELANRETRQACAAAASEQNEYLSIQRHVRELLAVYDRLAGARR